MLQVCEGNRYHPSLCLLDGRQWSKVSKWSLQSTVLKEVRCWCRFSQSRYEQQKKRTTSISFGHSASIPLWTLQAVSIIVPDTGHSLLAHYEEVSCLYSTEHFTRYEQIAIELEHFAHLLPPKRKKKNKRGDRNHNSRIIYCTSFHTSSPS